MRSMHPELDILSLEGRLTSSPGRKGEGVAASHAHRSESNDGDLKPADKHQGLQEEKLGPSFVPPKFLEGRLGRVVDDKDALHTGHCTDGV